MCRQQQRRCRHHHSQSWMKNLYRNQVVSYFLHITPYICSTYILAALPTPIPDSPSNPFRIRTNEDHACPGHEAGRETRSSTPTSRSGESFAQASPSSSMGQTPPQRSRGTPRVGRHSTVPSTINRSRPAATGGTRASPKRKKGARDVWTFFEETKDGCFCVFCK